MAFSLYAATVPSYQQTLGAVLGLLGKAETYCADHGLRHPALEGSAHWET